MHTNDHENPKYRPYDPTLVAHRDALALTRARLTGDEQAVATILGHPRYRDDPDATARLIMALTRYLADAFVGLGVDAGANPVERIDLALTEIDMAPYRTNPSEPDELGHADPGARAYRDKQGEGGTREGDPQ